MTHHHQHTHSHHPSSDQALPDVLDLDAEILAGPLRDVRADVADLADGPVRTVLDVGAGTGTGTTGLLQQFPEAYVTSLDADEGLLARLRQRVEEHGASDRVSTRQADLDHGLPDLGPVDLVWAAASLHHLADPDHTLGELAGALRPGGLLAVLELTGFPRFLPDETVAGRAEARVHELLAADRAVDMPAMASAWGERVQRAGLVVELQRDVVVDLEVTPGSPAGRYAATVLSRVRAAVADRLDAGDRAALDALLDDGPDDVRRRGDLRVRTTRQLVVARRPASRDDTA